MNFFIFFVYLLHFIYLNN